MNFGREKTAQHRVLIASSVPVWAISVPGASAGPCVPTARTFVSEPRRRTLTCEWWSTQCALVRMRRPRMMKPLPVLLNCRLRCHGRL